MKKILLSLVVLFSCAIAHSQNVGINTTGKTPHTSAILDLSSGNSGDQGLLIEKVALTATGTKAPVTSPENGLLVFDTVTNTTTAGQYVYPGFYYWSSAASKWIPILFGSEYGGWLLNGNTSISTPAAPATYGTSTFANTVNWLGTTDANDLVMGTNNKERMRVLSGGNVGIGTAAPTSLFSVNDGASAFTTGTLMSVTGNSLTSGTLLSLNSSGTLTGILADLEGNSATSGTLLNISANGLTSGFGINVASSAAFSGNLMFLNATNAGATGAAFLVKTVATAANAIWAIGNGSQAGTSAIWGYDEPGSAGTGIASNLSGHAIFGEQENTHGNFEYEFGVFGQIYSTNKYCGGTIGMASATADWGALGYQSGGGSTYGLYYTSTGGSGSGAGYLPSSAIQGIGAGGTGGVIGSWTRGAVMGQVSCGELFASYNLGNAYTSGYSAEIVTLQDKRVPAYTVTSTDIKVYNDGTGKLIKGRVHVRFDTAFNQLIGDNKPVVTVTPMGQCNGVYITNVTSKGFDVVELANGTSDVEFSYIVVGKRIDADGKPQLSADLAKKDFDDNMKGVMFNDNNTEHQATPIWWDGTKIRFDTAPVLQDNQNRKRVVIPQK